METYYSEDISRDNAYSIAANARRRHVIRLLLEESREWQVRALAETVAAREQECSTAEVEEECHQRVLLSLVHCDLPKLGESDVIVLEDETVTAGENIDDLAPLVR